VKRLSAVVLLLLLASSLRVAAQSERLFVRPWCDLEPFVRVGVDEYPLSRETAARRILEEGRILFSSMVYGYSFTYVPSDAARKVSETFTLTPVAEIPWGSRGVEILETTLEDKRLYARIAYTLTDAEAKRREAWDSSAVAMSTGSGKGSLFKGSPDKITALNNAMKDAIRSYLRSRVLNKPREVRGEIVLWEDPQTVERAGEYIATAKVRLRVTELVPYRIF
jgi:hypothetical protein